MEKEAQGQKPINLGSRVVSLCTLGEQEKKRKERRENEIGESEERRRVPRRQGREGEEIFAQLFEEETVV